MHTIVTAWKVPVCVRRLLGYVLQFIVSNMFLFDMSSFNVDKLH